MKNKKMFLLFSHKLNEEQKADAIKNLNVDEFVYLDENLQKIWSNVPTNLSTLKEFLIPFENFLKSTASKTDIVLVQGDFGAVYKMVMFCKSQGLIPVYATTKRIVEEIKEDDKIVKKSIFKHERYREYEWNIGTIWAIWAI